MELKKNTGLVFQLKPVGKVRRRLQSMRQWSFQETSDTVDLSHNESARLATDALLDGGLDAYNEVLVKDGEVDFLSRKEKDYILQNISEPTFVSLKDCEENNNELEATDSDSDQTYFPIATDSQPPELDHGWPQEDCNNHPQGNPSVDVHFQDSGSEMKDMLRQFISKATTVLAIVMDTFSDIEIFCDILEVMQKRSVSVYLLLDHQNLPIFLEMCNNLQITGSHLPKMSVRTVPGETYCAKSGKKFTGQIQEKFIIADCTEVLVGSYSFTWLSWRVHRSLAMVFKGSGVKPFDVEFRRLYASSLPVKELSVAGEPKSPPLYLGNNYFNSQPSTISSSTSTRTEQSEAVQRKAEARQSYVNTVLKDSRLPSTADQLIYTAAHPRYQKDSPLPSAGQLISTTAQPRCQTDLRLPSTAGQRIPTAAQPRCQTDLRLPSTAGQLIPTAAQPRCQTDLRLLSAGQLISTTAQPSCQTDLRLPSTAGQLISTTAQPRCQTDLRLPSTAGQLISTTAQPRCQTDLRLPSPGAKLIPTVAQARYQTALFDPGKVLISAPLSAQGPRHQQTPGPNPASLLPPRLQQLFTQRHSSFPMDYGVSALPWRPVVNGNNNHQNHHILAGVPQTARWALTQK